MNSAGTQFSLAARSIKNQITAERAAMLIYAPLRWCFLLALALILPGVVRAGFSPITLTSTSYNQDLVVENSAPAPVVAGAYTTASMDSGLGNVNTSWYEQGYNAANPTTGLPLAGSSFTSQSSADHQYTMAPSYKANNAVLLDSTLNSATLTLVTPMAYAGLSFLGSAGNSGVTFNYSVHHQNGATDTGTKSIPLWISGSNPAWTANGRVNVGSFAFSMVNSGNPRLYSLDIMLLNATSPVTSIDFTYVSGIGHGAVMAVSGLSGATYTPVAVTGYNADIVVEAGAGSPGALSSVTTATMDTGTANTITTWYEACLSGSNPIAGRPTTGWGICYVLI